MAQKSRIDTHNVALFAPFISKLAATPDGDGSLLDRSFVVYGGAIGNGNLHRHTDIPCLTFGTLGGKMSTGQHIVYDDDTPMCNLLVTLLNHVGLETSQFGDSSGKLPFDAARRG
jgi:hypothetical protein